MSKNASVTPNATLTLVGLDSGFERNKIKPAAKVTYKIKKNDIAASLAITDKTVNPLSNAQSLKDVVATVDVKAPRARSVTINSKYEFGPRIYQAGLTWDTTIANKPTTLKGWYSNRDDKFAGETTVNTAKGQKANITFNQSSMQTAKYTLQKGDFTYEPSYHFLRRAPAIAVTKRVSKDTVKLSYDLKSEIAALEWNRKPLKLTVSANASRKSGLSNPIVALNFEKTYDF